LLHIFLFLTFSCWLLLEIVACSCHIKLVNAAVFSFRWAGAAILFVWFGSLGTSARGEFCSKIIIYQSPSLVPLPQLDLALDTPHKKLMLSVSKYQAQSISITSLAFKFNKELFRARK